MSLVDENMQIIVDALSYYNHILLKNPEKPYENMFSLIKTDLEHERKNVGTTIRILQSKETPVETVLAQHWSGPLFLVPLFA